MKHVAAITVCLGTLTQAAFAGQVPFAASAPDIPVSHNDRIYSAEQFSNTVSVVDPADNTLVAVIRLGDPQPANLSPLYRGQALVHGMGFSPDSKTLAVVSIASNSVTFIDTATNTIRHTTYVGRSPHEAFFTQDGREVWVTVRGENYVSVIDATTYQEKARIPVPTGPGMQIFSPDGKYAYICSSFTPETDVVDVGTRAVVGRVVQASPFCPNIAATPDGREVWLTLKDSGNVQIFDARPPFALKKTFFTGPITNHVNFARTKAGTYAYVTIGGLNVVKVFSTRDDSLHATISVGDLPHGVWPSGDGSRVYVGLEGDDKLVAIDTGTNKVIGSVAIGQAPQAIAYVPNAVNNVSGLAPASAALGLAGQRTGLRLVSTPREATSSATSPTTVSLYDQGLTQVLEASVTGLNPGLLYTIGFSANADGSGAFQALGSFRTNPAGSAIVNAVGPIRQIVTPEAGASQRFLAIVPGSASQHGAPVQVQSALTNRVGNGH